MSEPTDPSDFEQTLLIGENDHGYEFCVGRIGDRWCGFAEGPVAGRGRYLFVWPEVAEGGVLGLTDCSAAIRLTGAIACDPESPYGGVTRWFVDEPLRGDPEEFRCELCLQVGCDGRYCRDDEPECGGP